MKFSVKEKFNDKNENSIKNKFIWCAASTHDGEEEICIDAHIKLKKKINKVVSIIIPRHIERAKKIEKLAKNCQKSGYGEYLLKILNDPINSSQ